MSRTRSFCWIAAAALLAAAPVAAQDAAGGQGADRTYTLVVKSAVGEFVRYQTQSTIKMEMKTASGESPLPMAPESTTDLTHKVKTLIVKPNGTMVNLTTVESGNIKVMGQSMPTPKTPAIRTEVDPMGRASVKGAEKLPGAQIMSQFLNMNNLPSTGMFMPDHPVKVGDNWVSEIAAPAGTGKMKITSTLLGTEEVGGRETLKIKQVTELPLEMMMGADQRPVADEAKALMTMKGLVSVNSIANVVAENGRLVKMVGDIVMKMQMTLKGDAAKQSPFGEQLNMTGGGTISTTMLSEGKEAVTAADLAEPAAQKATAAPKKPTAAKKATTATKKTTAPAKKTSGGSKTK